MDDDTRVNLSQVIAVGLAISVDEAQGVFDQEKSFTPISDDTIVDRNRHAP